MQQKLRKNQINDMKYFRGYLRSMRSLPFIFAFALVFCSLSGVAQNPQAKGQLIHVGAGSFLPLGDWGKSFKSSLSMSTALDHQWANGWILGLQADFLHAGKLKQGPALIEHLMTSEGEILANDGSYGSLQAELRGSIIGTRLMHVFKVPYGEWLVGFSVGYLRHKVGIFSSGGVPLLESPYTEGLDQLHHGINLSPILIYRYLDPAGRINFQIGLDAGFAQTQSIRGYNHFSRQPDTDIKFDQWIGLRAAWILPLLKVEDRIKYYQ
jgi:hypothetical protein|tara:strand:- start:5427 stop:6227 length:801 start_codon:yes stop_codon:yes gene_type:complete